MTAPHKLQSHYLRDQQQKILKAHESPDDVFKRMRANMSSEPVARVPGMITQADLYATNNLSITAMFTAFEDTATWHEVVLCDLLENECLALRPNYRKDSVDGYVVTTSRLDPSSRKTVLEMLRLAD